MKDDTSIEERIRGELDRMRAEVGAERPVPTAVLARARRGMAAVLAGVLLAAAVVVTGSVVAWRALAPTGPKQPIVPATQGTVTPTSSAREGLVAASPAIKRELMSRPLSLASVAPGASCPTTPTTRITPGRGTGFGGSASVQQAGNVFLAFAGREVKLRPGDRTSDGWYGIKDVWVIDGSYAGPLVIRGGRIDHRGGLQLDFNPTTPKQDALLLDSTAPSLQWDSSTGWWSVPTGAFVRTPGCYAYQIDGTGFTTHIVFEASR